jgi:hypothetical protein
MATTKPNKGWFGVFNYLYQHPEAPHWAFGRLPTTKEKYYIYLNFYKKKMLDLQHHTNTTSAQ